MINSKIEFAEHTLNLLTGCLYNCLKCSAMTTIHNYGGDVRRHMLETDKYHVEGDVIVLEEPLRAANGRVKSYPFGSKPTYHRYNLGKILSKMHMGQNVYVGALTDMFGYWVPDWIIDEVFDECLKYPRNNYMFLTHNPGRYQELAEAGKLPEADNFWYGSSITSPDSPWWYSNKHHYFVNIEPLKEEFPGFGCIDEKFPEWIIIGAETGKHKDKTVPEFEWIRKLVVEADYHATPVYMRNSLLQVVPEGSMRREVPKSFREKALSPHQEAKTFGQCCICGKTERRNEMVTLNARVRKGKNKTIAAMCCDCYINWCKEFGIKSRVEEIYEEKKLQTDNERGENAREGSESQKDD